jgi:hypothetical protein
MNLRTGRTGPHAREDSMLKKFAATGIVTVATAGAMMVAAPAFADNNPNAQGSLLGGTQLLPVSIPINGISLGLLGSAVSGNSNSGNTR